jgi:CRISPR-associated endonuclease/helicase Cas3
MRDFEQWFRTTTGSAPYAWQTALATPPACGDRLVRIPTGFGKTLGVLAAWLHHRVVRGDDRWPRRLVWTLPMRVLVEQTEDEVRTALGTLGRLWDGVGPHEDKVGVHVLMGGSDAGEWHLFPEECAVLVGTQDMLLSRGMNRGYGAARGRWPTDFGLLSQDALWVLDEVQLMDVGLATAAQLAAFRHADTGRAVRPSCTWAMSATLQRNWVQKSPDTLKWEADLTDVALGGADKGADLWAETHKPLHRLDPLTPKACAALIVERHRDLSSAAPLTLVVANTVDRARELFVELGKVTVGVAELHLLHSRFRGVERAAWRSDVLGPDAPKRSRIIVATQVIEAGVDLSADLMFTELCPWPSLVQRWGRLARRGGTGDAYVVGLDTSKAAAPYDAADLDAAWDALALLADASPRALDVFESQHADLLPGLYPYEPEHLLLREELDELFDTTPDLSGADLDISRYIRSGEERDVSVFWIPTPPTASGRPQAPDRKTRPVRDGLCAVPFLRARDWLCGKKSGDVEPKRLKEGVHAWVWDYLDGEWRTAERKDLWPGQTVLVDLAVGGYDPRLGWDGASKTPFPLVSPAVASAQDQADAAQDQEELSEADWQTVGFHGGAVAAVAERIARGLAPPELVDLLRLAARWHDLGKAHPAFQGAIIGTERPERCDLAKAPNHAWRHGRTMYQVSKAESRPGFRHELASTLGLFAVLQRHAPPDHPSRLGSLATLLPSEPATSQAPPGPLESEILALAPDAFDLVAYLVCSHHGKLRARLHCSPADQTARLPSRLVPLRGVCDGDTLPPTALEGRDGATHVLPPATLSLEPASLGLSSATGRSWVERVDALVRKHGPFTLAWLEAILRAADVRASKDKSLVDPALRDAKGMTRAAALETA